MGERRQTGVRVRAAAVGQRVEPRPRRRCGRRQTKDKVRHRLHHQHPLGNSALVHEAFFQEFHCPFGVLQEEPQPLDRSPAHPGVGVGGVGDEGVGMRPHQVRGVGVDRGLFTVLAADNGVDLFGIHRLPTDAEQQCDDRRPVRRRRVIRHREQERHTGHRARIHTPLMQHGAIETAERLFPHFRVRRHHAPQPSRNVVGRPVSVSQGRPVGLLQVVDHERHYAGWH